MNTNPDSSEPSASGDGPEAADVERWAREASAFGSADELSGDAITRFATLVRAAALEEAAVVCAKYEWCDDILSSGSPGDVGTRCAAVIRSMNKDHQADRSDSEPKAVDVDGGGPPTEAVAQAQREMRRAQVRRLIWTPYNDLIRALKPKA